MQCACDVADQVDTRFNAYFNVIVSRFGNLPHENYPSAQVIYGNCTLAGPDGSNR